MPADPKMPEKMPDAVKHEIEQLLSMKQVTAVEVYDRIRRALEEASSV